MKGIYKYLITAMAAVLSFASCEEFQPVFTGKYPQPEPWKIYTDADFAGMEMMAIADLKSEYTFGNPFVIEEDWLIKGQVISSDKSGNMYRSFYIDDGTGGIEIKVGKTGLYNDYKPGQWVYVKCKGLTLGGYRGMTHLGYKSLEDKYETSYIDVQYFIDTHIFRGEADKEVEPIVLDAAKNLGSVAAATPYFGRYVKVSGFKYDGKTFTLMYVDPDGDREDYSGNCVFLDEEDPDGWGVRTWAMSEEKCKEYLDNGNFDAGTVDGTTVGEIRKGNHIKNGKVVQIKPTAYAVSQYFKNGDAELQVRTSGYAKFADTELDKAIQDGASVTFTGILSIYTGKNGMEDDPKLQFTLIDLESGVTIE